MANFFLSLAHVILPVERFDQIEKKTASDHFHHGHHPVDRILPGRNFCDDGLWLDPLVWLKTDGKSVPYRSPSNAQNFGYGLANPPQQDAIAQHNSDFC
jgi:hypothetical protein